jgi:hypothetical protein
MHKEWTPHHTSFAPETISPERNERDQYPTRMLQNQRITSFVLPLITVWLQVRLSQTSFDMT